jgi:hypothetical protein
MRQFSNLQVKRQSIRVLNTITVILFFAVLFGCATGSSIITGMKRPAINPNEVKIYLDPPAKFETIGIVETASGVVFSRQAAQDYAMDELKKRAAKVGANGVLLTNTGSQAGGTTGIYSNGFFYGGTSSDKILAQGRAIYVIQE